MKISLNPQTIYGVSDPAEAFPDMVRRGMPAFEQWSIAPERIRPLREAMDATGSHLVAFCTRTFNLTAPEARDAYLAGLEAAIADAVVLGCPFLITQVGDDTGEPRELQHQSILAGLRACVPMLEASGITLLVESLNTVKDHKTHYLSDSREMFALVRETGSPNVRALFDIYHQLHMGEPVLERIREGFDLISHYHVAGLPVRDERIWEGFDYTPVFRLLDELGYEGHVGMELFPAPGKAVAFLDRLQKQEVTV